MTLDIIVPHYKEPWELCKYLFDSIALQRGVPFELIKVIVVNDGDDCVLSALEWADYPFRVDYIIKPHGGVSAARNAGLMESKADYVMFCDADDGFLNNYGLHLVFSAMREGADYIISNFAEETFDAKGNAVIINHDHDITFMHGKAYRRQFLIEHDLLFDPAMTLHEDGYFNMVVYAVADHEGTLKKINAPFYLWRWNDNSVVRKNRENFVLRTYDDVMLTRIELCKQLKQRGYEDEYQTAVIMTVMNSYYDFQKTTYTTVENAKHTKKAEKAFKRFWTLYHKDFLSATNQRVAEVARVARENAYKNGMLFEKVALLTWLDHIESEVK